MIIMAMTLQVPSHNQHHHHDHNASVISRVSVWSAEPKFCAQNYYNIILDLLILILTFSEIALVLYLSITHFLHSNKDVEGMAMLLPIIFNFIGVIYFLSNPVERLLFESMGYTRCCTDTLQFPVFGPVLTAFMVFLVSCGWSENENYQRLEASAAKMRQATTFFSAAPEALVQLTVLLIHQKDDTNLEVFLEIAIVIVAVFAIAEANTFGLVTDYFRIFHEYDEDDWELTHEVGFWQKVLLFAHAFTSVGSRLMSSALLKAALYSYYELDFAMALIISLISEMAYRTALYYIARVVKHIFAGHEVPSGCYESLNFAWRETILSFGFQSRNILVQLWFYIENIVFFIFSMVVVKHAESIETRDIIYLPGTITFCTLTIASFLTLALLNLTRIFVLRLSLQRVKS